MHKKFEGDENKFAEKFALGTRPGNMRFMVGACR